MIKRYRFVGLFTLAYMAGFGALVVSGGNREFIFYGGVMAALITAVLLIDARVRFSMGVLWGLAIWGFLHMAGGNVPIPDELAAAGGKPVLYSLWIVPERLKFDHLVHAFGFFVTTMVCFESMRQRLIVNGRVSTGAAVLVAAAGMGFGAINEVVEFIAVLTIPDTNVGGYENTGWDLVANTFGASVAAIVIRLRRYDSVSPS